MCRTSVLVLRTIESPLPTNLIARLGQLGTGERCDRPEPAQTIKKADVVKHPEAFDHVGLLFTEPPGVAGLPFI